MNRITVKSAAFSLLMGVATAAVAWAFPAGLLLAPAFLGFAAVAWGAGALIIAAASAAVGIFALTGGDAAGTLMLVCMFLPASAIIFVYLSNKKTYRTAVALSAAAMALALYALTCLEPLLAGEDPFSYFITAADAFGKQVVAAAPAMGAQGDALKFVERFAAYLKLVAPEMAVTAIVSMGMAFGFFDVIIARALCVRNKVDTKRMAPFYRWQLTRGFSLGSLILIAGALAVTSSSLKNTGAVVAAVECIVGLPYALMGVCLMAFGLKLKVRSRTYFTVCMVAMALLLPYSIYGLCIMGVADRIFGIRRRVQF